MHILQSVTFLKSLPSNLIKLRKSVQKGKWRHTGNSCVKENTLCIRDLDKFYWLDSLISYSKPIFTSSLTATKKHNSKWDQSDPKMTILLLLPNPGVNFINMLTSSFKELSTQLLFHQQYYIQLYQYTHMPSASKISINLLA